MKILDIVKLKKTGQIGFIMCSHDDNWDVQFLTEYPGNNEDYFRDIVTNSGSYKPEELTVLISA